MEGGDLRALSQGAPVRSWFRLRVVATLALSMVLVTPLDVGALSAHAPRHVPRLVGLSRERVFAIMRADQLYFSTTGPGSATGHWLEVTAQSPAPGTVVAWHALVHLTVTTRSPRGPRPVPRLTGLSRARTFLAMKRAGLYFSTRGPGSLTETWVVVLHQSPAPGTRVAWHATVELTVGTHRARPPVKRVRPESDPTTTVHHPTTTVVRRTTTTTTTAVATTTVPVPTTTSPGTTTTSTNSTTTAPGATTTLHPTTTTVHPTTTTTPKAKIRAKRFRVGVATWYEYFPGRCATWYLPFGTRVVVRDLATGRSITCVVTDREVARGSRVVDLSREQFAQLAPLWRGVVDVEVSW